MMTEPELVDWIKGEWYDNERTTRRRFFSPSYNLSLMVRVAQEKNVDRDRMMDWIRTDMDRLRHDLFCDAPFLTDFEVVQHRDTYGDTIIQLVSTYPSETIHPRTGPTNGTTP